jgi:hypothetical protein
MNFIVFIGIFCFCTLRPEIYLLPVRCRTIVYRYSNLIETNSAGLFSARSKRLHFYVTRLRPRSAFLSSYHLSIRTDSEIDRICVEYYFQNCRLRALSKRSKVH